MKDTDEPEEEEDEDEPMIVESAGDGCSEDRSAAAKPANILKIDPAPQIQSKPVIALRGILNARESALHCDI